jgi:hypothetical protein
MLAGSRRRVFLYLLFSLQLSECSVIQSATAFSVAKPLITSVSPSGQRTSTTQPDPGFFRARKWADAHTSSEYALAAGGVQAAPHFQRLAEAEKRVVAPSDVSAVAQRAKAKRGSDEAIQSSISPRRCRIVF